jgi:hypothetical protein
MKSASATEVRKTLRPGQPGTRRLQRDWGARLVCVRHRVDPKKGVRFTTAEIVVSAERIAKARRASHPEALVYARVGVDESNLRRRLMAAKAATYDSHLKVWTMQYATALRLGLGRRLSFRRPRPSPSSRTHSEAGNANIPAHRQVAIPAHPGQNSHETE